MKCLKCHQEKEFDKDKFCQTCEGKYGGAKCADVINFELNKVLEVRQIDQSSHLAEIFKEKIKNRWITQHLKDINSDQFPDFISSFLDAVNSLTGNSQFNKPGPEIFGNMRNG